MKGWTYQGGGYWREAHVPRGEKAEILHGDEALEMARWELVAEFLAGAEDSFEIESPEEALRGAVVAVLSQACDSCGHVWCQAERSAAGRLLQRVGLSPGAAYQTALEIRREIAQQLPTTPETAPATSRND